MGKKLGLLKHSGYANVTLDFKTSGQSVHFHHKEKPNPFSSDFKSLIQRKGKTNSDIC